MIVFFFSSARDFLKQSIWFFGSYLSASHKFLSPLIESSSSPFPGQDNSSRVLLDSAYCLLITFLKYSSPYAFGNSLHPLSLPNDPETL